MSQIRQQANAVLNAMDEARVQTIITLFDAGKLVPIPGIEDDRRGCISQWCQYLGVQDIDYWLDEWFRVTNG